MRCVLCCNTPVSNGPKSFSLRPTRMNSIAAPSAWCASRTRSEYVMAPAGISSEVVRNAGSYCDVFLHGDPFKHVVIENFLEPAFAERLLADFPSFNPRLATNELGMTAR